MKKNSFQFIALLLLAISTAEGYGRNASGGRGGRILHVTNLNDAQRHGHGFRE